MGCLHSAVQEAILTQIAATLWGKSRGRRGCVSPAASTSVHGIDQQAIAKTARLRQAQPLWGFVLPGSRGYIDFGEQFPYDPKKAKPLLDPDTTARASDTLAGHYTISHDDTPVDVLIDRMNEAGTEEAFLQARHDCQGHIAEGMLTTRVTSPTFLRAAPAWVKGYEHWHRFMIRFETTWLDKP
jgi:hypothetical protein